MDRSDPHPLRSVLLDAVAGRFPAPDGGVELLAPDAAGTCAVVELTGHSYILTDLPASAFDGLGVDGFGGATNPAVLLRLAGERRSVGALDVVLARHATPGPARLAPLDDVDDHPRVLRARRHRSDVRVIGDDRGVVCVGRGLVGRLEISVELTGAAAGSGAGRDLVTAGLAGLPDGEPVFAQVSPGNAASLRTFLACGFVPIGSEVLIADAHTEFR